MSKNKKQDRSVPGERGMFYDQGKCSICGKLVVANSPTSCNAAKSELGRKLKAHRKECRNKK
ncbi:hypothetical protein ES702_02008 [subsurface metagenome]